MNFLSALTQPMTFPVRIRRFLREGNGLDRIPEQMRQALAAREARFLEIIKHRVYAHPLSPYRKLLDHAGCSFADVSDLTKRHGLEGALRKLSEAGVYLRAVELKGKEDVVRGRLRFRVVLHDLRMVFRGF